MVILIVSDVMLSGRGSLNVTVNAKDPVSPGVPEITPVAAFSDNPGGSAPVASVHVYGETPPRACSRKEYGALTVPAVKSPVVSITSGPGTTVICSG